MAMRPTRRAFLQTSAGAAGAVLAAKQVLLDPEVVQASSGPGPASDRVRFGMIGVGMQGSGLLSTSITLPGVECAAACDLYDGRQTLAREIAGPKPRTTRRYQELLADKDIDCIVAAVPDHWHRKIVVDAVSAGKDVYCEKPMSHTAADGFQMVAAAEKSGRIVQIGSQRVSSVVCAKARELIAGGALGDISLVEGSLGRNDPTGAWVYPPPPDLSPATLDWDTWQGDVPKRPFDPIVFARWRCFKEYGTGMAGDLMVHLISGMLYAWGLNEAPTRAMAMGGILRWKDGRNMPDVKDVELGYRLRAAAHRIRLVREAQVTHLKRWTLGSWLASDLRDRAIPWARLAAGRRAACRRTSTSPAGTARPRSSVGLGIAGPRRVDPGAPIRWPQRGDARRSGGPRRAVLRFAAPGSRRPSPSPRPGCSSCIAPSGLARIRRRPGLRGGRPLAPRRTAT